MDYIVSAEDSPYYHWQLELLIESFKKHGLQDRLLIALAASDLPREPDFTRHLNRHPRILYHDNMGRRRGYPYLNKPYAVSTAVSQKKISQPFTVIEPDMVMYWPLEAEKEPLAFQVKHFFNLELVEQHVPNIREYIEMGTGQQSLWLPIGSVYSFNGVPDDLFGRVISWAEMLAFDHYKAQTDAKQPVSFWRYLERAGWVLAFLDYLKYLPYKGSHTYEMSLLDHDAIHNFVHYSSGQPPVFSKSLFRFEPPVYFAAASSPFAALVQETPTSSAFFMKQIVESYRGQT